MIGMLREGQIMKIHYITGIAALFVVAVHIIVRLITPSFSLSLVYENVIKNYHNMPYIILLESILILVAIHGFNGLRIILLELRQNKPWEDGVVIFTIAATIALIAYGTRTIIVASGLGLG
ncbi:MAG: succinate dehydrogenase [Nitrososphaeraceae archaeon]|jgi:succinate dehydrogenase / fumarate reductase membrane anchor subunit